MTKEEWAAFVAESERQEAELHKAKYRRAAWGELAGLVPALPVWGIWIIVILILI